MNYLIDSSKGEVLVPDEIDRDIISMLQLDGRASASFIAQEIGMSIPTVTDRIKKLQESGVIIGYTAILDHRKVGLDVCAFITIISESSSHYADVVRESNKTSEIVQCFTTTGNGSHVLLAITENTITLEKLLRKVQSWPGVIRTETQMVLSSYKAINKLKIPKK